MVKYLVDTNILIDFLKNQKREIDILGSLDDGKMAISIITFAEVMEGVLNTAKEDQVREFLHQFTALPVSISTAEIFTGIRCTLRKKGNIIDNMDLLIAATAIENNLTLITNNIKDFERITALKIYKKD